MDSLSMPSTSIFRMKEDQTPLITARLEHLRFMMDSGKMPIFRHRSDMFLFALEAHNIARGLSSRYYRLQEDLDIRFFVRFPFDYWLQAIQGWIKELETDKYRVDDGDFYAEGRAKRLTVVVDRLFGYHLDHLPQDSALGSMPLSDEEILEPLRAIMQMKSTDLVASYRNALQEVYNYLDRLATMPLDWSEEKRHKALQLYLADAEQTEAVKSELKSYRYFCRMPEGKTSQGHFCYLRQRLAALTSDGELQGMSLSKRQQQTLLDRLAKRYAKDETHPAEDQIPVDAKPMAGDELFTKMLRFIKLDDKAAFPLLDSDEVFNFLIRKDVVLNTEQEHNLQALFALLSAMREQFAKLKAANPQSSSLGDERQERIQLVLSEAKKYNAKLSSLLDYKREISELDAFFERLFSSDWQKDYGKAQDDLLHLFEKDRDEIQLKPYIRMLRVAQDCMNLFKRTTSLGKKIYSCLREEPIMADVTDSDTIQSYYSKQGYGVTTDHSWELVIKLLAAVKKEYRSK